MNKTRLLHLILHGVCALFCVIGFALALISNGVESYAFADLGRVLGVLIPAVVLCLALIVLGYLLGKRHLASILLSEATLILMMLGLLFVLEERVVIASSLMTYDSSNELGRAAVQTSIISIVFLLLASIVSIVGAFLPEKEIKDEENTSSNMPTRN